MKSNIFLFLKENIITIFYALILALIIRSFLFQPFYIPSSSMEPTLQIGDRLFVSKYQYGYSKHSFPFSPPISNKKFLKKDPERGDIIVFKTPADNRTDYIKRLIGLPGDKIQFINGFLYINDKKIPRKETEIKNEIFCGNEKLEVETYIETLPNKKEYLSVYRKEGSMQNTDVYLVPANHFFFLGDNRDCSNDSRFLTSVGYVKHLNLVGKAKILFFSSDKKKGKFFQFWRWHNSFRFNRFFRKIK